MLSHPLCWMHFSQYQASSAVLGDQEVRTAISCTNVVRWLTLSMQYVGSSSSNVAADSFYGAVLQNLYCYYHVLLVCIYMCIHKHQRYQFHGIIAYYG